MTWSITSRPSKLAAILRFLRKRVAITTEDLGELVDRARETGELVAKVAQLDLVSMVLEALEKSIARGLPLEDFKREIAEKVRDAWSSRARDIDGKPIPAYRAATIARTNAQRKYSAGRYHQARHPETLRVRPFHMFDAILDSRTSPICSRCEGVILPADHPWWTSHIPPLHWNCRSTVITLTEVQAVRRGVTVEPPSVGAQDGFGGPPEGAPWGPNPGDYDGEFWAAKPPV